MEMPTRRRLPRPPPRFLAQAQAITKVVATIGLSVAIPAATELIFGNQPILISLGLAPLIVEEVFAGLQRVIDLGVSVILIEQFVHRALAIADQCYVLRRGRVVWSGETADAGADLLEHYLGGSNGDQM